MDNAMLNAMTEDSKLDTEFKQYWAMLTSEQRKSLLIIAKAV